MRTSTLAFRLILKTALASAIAITALYCAVAWAGMANPARGALKGVCLLVLVVLSGWGLWRFVRWIGFRRGGPGSGSGPSVREPRPPGGRPPTLSAAARAEDD